MIERQFPAPNRYFIDGIPTETGRRVSARPKKPINYCAPKYDFHPDDSDSKSDDDDEVASDDGDVDFKRNFCYISFVQI